LVFWLFVLILEQWSSIDRPRRLAGAWFGAALWSVHPIQVESVTYIVQRMTSAAALFVILSVIAYLKGRTSRRRRGGWLLLALLAWALGSGFKEIAWITPALWLLAELGIVRHGEGLIRGRRDWLWLSVPLSPLLFLLFDSLNGFHVWHAQTDGYVLRDFTLMERLMTQPRVVVFHLSQLIWPLSSRFSLLHDFPKSTSLVSPPSTLIAILFALLCCCLGCYLLFNRRSRMIGGLLLWVPTTLALESTVLPLRMIFEHRMYLPSVGVAGLVGLAVAKLTQHTGRKRQLAVYTVLAATTGLIALSTSRVVPVWRSDFTLWADVTRKHPCSAEGLNNLGKAYWTTGDIKQATEKYEAALICDPDDLLANLNLARSYRELGQLEKALGHYRRLLILAPQWADVHYSLGMLYMEIGQLDRARVEFTTTLELDPEHPQAGLFLSFVSR
jgi:hypothetical protein